MDEQKKRFDLGAFNGEESIDRTQIIITHHAVDRYQEYLFKNSRTHSRPPKIVEQELQQLLNGATYKNAAGQFKRVDTIQKYGEQQYFFRNGRWQFVVAHDKENLGAFILKTVIWLNNAQYQSCFR